MYSKDEFEQIKQRAAVFSGPLKERKVRLNVVNKLGVFEDHLIMPDSMLRSLDFTLKDREAYLTVE